MDPDARLSLPLTEDDSADLSQTGFGLWKREKILIHVDKIMGSR